MKTISTHRRNSFKNNTTNNNNDNKNSKKFSSNTYIQKGRNKKK